MFTTIITHERPHMDEIFAIMMLKKWGNEKFPGIKEAKIVFAGAGGEAFDGATGDELEMAGVVMIGVGAGKFDEHPGAHVFGKEDECASTLVAKALGIENDPALEKLLRYAKNSDLKGDQPFELASLVKTMHSVYKDQPAQVIKWAMSVLEAKYHEQREFVRVTKEESGNTDRQTIYGPRGEALLMISAVTGSETFNKVARHQGASIVVQQQPSGNMQIYTNAKALIKLHEAAQILRVEEQRAKGDLQTTDWQTLASEGKVAGVPEWYYHKQGEMLLNGSLSCPNVTPTNLTLARMKELIVIAMDTRSFEPSRSPECKKGICASTEDNPCLWYDYGLSRCRNVRRTMKK